MNYDYFLRWRYHPHQPLENVINLIQKAYPLLAPFAAAILGQMDRTSIGGSGIGIPPSATPPTPPLSLLPSTPSQTHFVNESFIIYCQTVQKDIDTKWRDPRGQTRENTKGRVHIEKKTSGKW